MPSLVVPVSFCSAPPEPSSAWLRRNSPASVMRFLSQRRRGRLWLARPGQPNSMPLGASGGSASSTSRCARAKSALAKVFTLVMPCLNSPSFTLSALSGALRFRAEPKFRVGEATAAQQPLPRASQRFVGPDQQPGGCCRAPANRSVKGTSRKRAAPYVER